MGFASNSVLGKKVQFTLVQTLRLCTGRTAYRGSRGIVLPFHDHGTRRGWGVSVTPRPLFTRGKEPVPIYRRLGGPVWTSAENLAPTGIRSTDRPARSQSLYRICYPAHISVLGLHITEGKRRRRGRGRKQLGHDRVKAKTPGIESGSTRSYSLQSSLLKRLWTVVRQTT